MGGSHDHGAAASLQVPARVRNLTLLALVPLVLVTLAGLVVLWPSGEQPTLDSPEFVAGVVTEIGECDPPDPTCELITFEVTEGEDAGVQGTTQATADAGLEVGTRVWLVPVDGAYSLADIRRDRPLLLLAALAAVAIVALAGWKGLAALGGLAASVLVLVAFVVPALLTGGDPLAVAVVGSSTIALATMGLAHGVTVRTAVALIGTLLALALTAVLGAAFTAATSLSGATGEEAFLLQSYGITVDMRGLLLAGLVIGALGVLDDVTITQAAAVWEVRRADALAGGRTLFAAGMRVGRDHVAATVNTLVLAYAGAALPLFLLLSLSTAPLAQSLSIEIVAQEIVRTLVGTLGIVAAVPLTTAMAAWVLAQTPGRAPTEHAGGEGGGELAP